MGRILNHLTTSVMKISVSLPEGIDILHLAMQYYFYNSAKVVQVFMVSPRWNCRSEGQSRLADLLAFFGRLACPYSPYGG